MRALSWHWFQAPAWLDLVGNGEGAGCGDGLTLPQLIGNLNEAGMGKAATQAGQAEACPFGGDRSAAVIAMLYSLRGSGPAGATAYRASFWLAPGYSTATGSGLSPETLVSHASG
jgi:hypothetical protein